MSKFLLSFTIFILFPCSIYAQQEYPKIIKNKVIVKTSDGLLEGIKSLETGITHFWGVPYAQPPIGKLRWQAPQPIEKWEGIRKADHFGPTAMQAPIFSDMRFRTNSTSEDCLYLNIWTPNVSSKSPLPVLVYFHGGGFVAGAGSEWRYDGTSLAQKGIVVVTINYRLGIFGFFAHPALTKESPHQSSGNYGLLDQHAALVWVRQNISSFGGNPNHITIGGESAGSISVSAQMASPLSKDLIVGAIGESGAMIYPTLPAIPLAKAEQRGLKFAENIRATSLKELRALSSEQLLKEASKMSFDYFTTTIDGYFLPQSPEKIFEEGKQALVPLLVGWNSTEVAYNGLMGDKMPTPNNYKQVVKDLYKENYKKILNRYPGNTMPEVIASATNLTSDRFIVFSTWKWSELHRATPNQQVYRYLFEHPRPEGWSNDAHSKLPPPIKGAAHSWEIEYALGNLSTNNVYPWTPDDYRVSATMEGYFAQFIKYGNPNGKGLPQWVGNNQYSPVQVMQSQLKPESSKRRKQFEILDKLYSVMSKN